MAKGRPEVACATSEADRASRVRIAHVRGQPTTLASVATAEILAKLLVDEARRKWTSHWSAALAVWIAFSCCELLSFDLDPIAHRLAEGAEDALHLPCAERVQVHEAGGPICGPPPPAPARCAAAMTRRADAWLSILASTSACALPSTSCGSAPWRRNAATALPRIPSVAFAANSCIVPTVVLAAFAPYPQ